jgi:small subunit ribosomal protein S13
MPRIAGVDLPRGDKRVEIGLTYIHGIGRSRSNEILSAIDVRKGMPVRGQRTRTNARTRKGPRKTVAGRRRSRLKK